MYSELIALLEATKIPCAERAFNSAPTTGSYLTYQLDGEGDVLWGDNMQLHQVITGSVDLYCRTKDRTDFNAVQSAFKAWDGSWDLNSIQTEPDNRLIHYEWTFQMEKI